MSTRPRRHPELTRWYAVAALTAFVFLAFRLYRLWSPQVESGLAASTRWGLLAVGLVNALAIAALVFLVARNLAKVWFERRRGILGGRIRTRLVLALLGVGILPSLLLYITGRDFISKNIDRWFMPETRQIYQDGKAITEAYRAQVLSRLQAAEARLHPGEDLERLRQATGLDLVARRSQAGRPYGVALAPGQGFPSLDQGPVVETVSGTWFLLHTQPEAQGAQWVLGLKVPQEHMEVLGRMEKRSRDLAQMSQSRRTLETLPQNTFLLLTLFSIFAAVWTGLTLSRAISEPVQALADAAHKVGAGRLDIHLDEAGEDELAFLSRAFNRMTRDLKGSREAIEAQAARIERQRAYLTQLLEALPVGVLSWMPDGELRTFNPAARRWLDLEGSEDTWEALATQPRFGTLPGLLEDVRRTRRARLEELRLGPEGEGRPVRAMVVPLEGGGELALLEDLSQLALAEKRAAWQEVARRMAHEVKNPLTPIKLTAQRLRRRALDGPVDPTLVADCAETILGEVQSLQTLVDSFSRFAKLPAPQFRPVDAVELLQQVAALYVPNHPAHHWEIDLPEGPLPAQWDGDMVKRAVINLVDNALGALTRPGTLRIQLDTEGGEARLRVQDDGPGVPPEARERLFQPYFSTKRKGTGLGLAIVRRIAQDHGGEAYYTPLEPGSAFELRIPLRAQEG